MTLKENLENILKVTKEYNPRLIAVSKYYDIDKIQEAYDLGLRDFAESKVQDSIKKINKLDDTTKSQSIYHFIGHLQTNKTKYAVGFFEYIHSVDSLKLAESINLEAGKKGIVQKILIQVNNAKEPQKFGIYPSELENLIEKVANLKSLELCGLMNIAPYTDDIDELRRLFKDMYNLKEQYHLKELSMGMSHDYKIALECGATMIRLGRILFD